MPASSLSEELLAQLQGAPMQRLSAQLGANPQQTEAAIQAALPLLLGALGRNSANPQGADELMGALRRDHSAVDLGGLLGGLLGGGSAMRDGGNILGHIFGGARSRTEDSFGRATGLGNVDAGRLLQMLAPIVLAFLAQRFARGSSGAGDLGAALGREERGASVGPNGGLLGTILDQNGDGRVDLGDLIKVGTDLFSQRR